MIKAAQPTRGNAHATTSTKRSHPRHAWLLAAIACFALSAAAHAAPRPDGDIGNGNTAGGSGALISLTTGGTNNSGIGYQSLFRLTTGGSNTAVGYQSMYSTTTASGNTGMGSGVLYYNTTGAGNTASGYQALTYNTVGNENTAAGDYALLNNTTGNQNTATGSAALFNSTIAFQNTAIGSQALYTNTTGNFNTALGFESLYLNTTGSYNIALGYYTGANLTTGSYNIDIGNPGVSGESGTIRIGTDGNQTATFVAGVSGVTVAAGTAVVIDANGQLGSIVSSKRYKEDIKPMDKASEALLALKPVTFRYKHELDAKGIPQFGLVAEDVEKVNPDLVARDADGKVYTVRYEAVNAMLLNEFLKEHANVERLQATVAELKSTVATQQASVARQQEQFEAASLQQAKAIEILTAQLKEQASQIQRVSAQLEVSKTAPQVVANDR